MPVVAAITASAHASSQMVSIPIGLEMVAIVIASISGALTAREHRLDLVGAIGLAVVTSLGGGLLRDMTLQVGNVYILNQPLALPIAISTAAITFVFPAVFQKQDRVIGILDIFAVGLYAATGSDKAMVYGFDAIVCVMMGVFTGVGGGMLRDICLGKTPNIFQPSNFYAVAAIAGATAYVVMVQNLHISNIISLIACVAITMGLRYLSLHYDIKSPSEVDIPQMVHKVRHAATRQETSGHGTGALAERRERVQADIDARRKEERKRTALDRLKRVRRNRAQRHIDT